MRNLCWFLRRHPEPDAVTAAREALERVEADEPRVEALRVDHEGRIRRNDFGPKIAAALHIRHIRANGS